MSMLMPELSLSRTKTFSFCKIIFSFMLKMERAWWAPSTSRLSMSQCIVWTLQQKRLLRNSDQVITAVLRLIPSAFTCQLAVFLSQVLQFWMHFLFETKVWNSDNHGGGIWLVQKNGTNSDFSAHKSNLNHMQTKIVTKYSCCKVST